MAMVATPLVVFGLAELGLRLVGYGHPTGFFLDRTQAERPLLIENCQFGWRFFPPHLARTPQPEVLPATKPAATSRIFFFGESAVMGDPDSDFGLTARVGSAPAGPIPRPSNPGGERGHDRHQLARGAGNRAGLRVTRRRGVGDLPGQQ